MSLSSGPAADVDPAKIIDGKGYADGLVGRVGAAVAEQVASGARKPGLAVVLVGDDPASRVYVANKAKRTVEAGMASIEHRLPAETDEATLLDLVARLNADDAVDGILVQSPLPPGLRAERVIDAIAPEKDVDGFHALNVGRLGAGLTAMVPCTPLGSLMLLKSRLGDLSGAEAVVIGRSNIVGKPMAQLLLAENCTVSVAHSRTRDLPAVARRADIVVAAVGRPEMVRGDWLKPGATVIDVGINRVPAPDADASGKPRTRLVGDVAFSEAAAVAGAITPVPGGVGPMTIACLLANTLTAYHRRRGLEDPVL